MRPGSSLPTQPGTPGRARRRPDLTLPMPQRDVSSSLAVPLPLPPPSSLPGPAPPPAAAAAVAAAGSASAAAVPPPPLAELERVRRVGSGAGGTVWMVRHRSTGRAYALKVLYGNHDDAVRRQIAREIAILRTAEHPAVVRCHGMYERGGELQILLEYMDGGSLDGRRIAAEPFLADVARQSQVQQQVPFRRVVSTGDLVGTAAQVGRYSAEERRERIEKYHAKRNQRNFQKKITYACRKTLADSRPRVKGRFARNDGADAADTEFTTDHQLPNPLMNEASSSSSSMPEWWPAMQQADTLAREDEELLAAYLAVSSINLY